MLAIHLLGHLQLFDDERPLPFTTLPKTLPLLAYLLLNRAAPVPRQTLCFLLWPDLPEEQLRANLRRHLYDLQNALPETPPERPWLLRQADTVQWNPAAAYWLDVAEFERLCHSPEHLGQAISLYTDDLLPELYEDWIIPYREQLRHRYLATLGQLVERARQRRDYPQALAYAQQALSCDPLPENLARQLMRLRYESGDRAGAVQFYREFEHRLQEELGVAPMPETTSLYQAILDNSLVKPPPGRPSEPSPAAHPPALLHNLPAQLTSFFGRTLDLITLHELLAEPNSTVRLLTLTGPAGTGKTRLALETAARLLPDQVRLFPDGIFFVDLSAVTRPEQVMAAVAETLGLKERAGRPLAEALKEYVHARYLLLILDNFEQVLAAGALVADLLAAAPGLRVVVTSRAPLQLHGEHEYPVPPLPWPSSARRPPAEELLEYAAISLFVARARAANPAFTLTRQNAPVVAEICHRLDGLPLAIELAAARSKQFSPAGILKGLGHSLAFLTGRARDVPARQQTLRQAIQRSYDLLTEAEKKLFVSLAPFAGGFTPAAVAAVSFESDEPSLEARALDLLLSLADKNMVRQVGREGTPRFEMLLTLREYALERLAAQGRLARRQQRHAAYYLALAERASVELVGCEQLLWLDRLSAEHDNLRAALEWALAASDQPGIAEAFYCLGMVALRREAYGQAAAFLEQSVALLEGTGQAHSLALSLSLLGVVAQEQGDCERATGLLERALALSRAENNPQGIAFALNVLGDLARLQDAYERAAGLYEESLALARQLAYRARVARPLHNLGHVRLHQGEYEQARQLFHEALALSHELGDKVYIAACLAGLGAVLGAAGDAAQGVQLFGAATAFLEAAGGNLDSVNQRAYQRNLAIACSRLAPAAFEAAWQAGRAMPPDQAVTGALASTLSDDFRTAAPYTAERH
ncbi:MAG: tetratricopeptide repeat protein [Chloroflexi bacterium]|nr:tetratricopeptide repeat protein [Chloroflexota bacterium]MCI0725165.1 tetratricopeptide repeat protein [Chloroflexota bacterium]